MLRATTWIVLGFSTALWLWLMSVFILKGGGMAAYFAPAVSAAFLIFALPALLLVGNGKFLGLALILALLSLASLVLTA